MANHLLSQLAHVELLTPRPQESLEFFVDVLGMEESDRRGQSVYLRAWGERFHHSLKLTESETSGVAHVGWRADSEDDVARAEEIIEPTGLGRGWSDGDVGHGRSYTFVTPDGHSQEIFWDVERYVAPPAMASGLKARPQKFVTRGSSVRRIDHVNLFCSEVTPGLEFFRDQLGFRLTELIRLSKPAMDVVAFLTVTGRDHDLTLTLDSTHATGRLNHVAYWQDTRDEIMRLADICGDMGIALEGGPTRHGPSELFFLYVWEPGGNRIEICSGGYLSFEPDVEPIVWDASENPGVYWSGEMPRSCFTYGTPPVPVDEADEQDH